MHIRIGICIWNEDVRIPNCRYTISRVRTRGQPGLVRVRRDIAGRCECGGRVRMYGAGDGGAALTMHRRWGRTTGNRGSTRT